MNNTKEHIISLITQTMSESLSSDQLDLLTYTLSSVLKDYNIDSSTQLPSVDLNSTEKLIKRFLATKKIEGCTYNTLLQYKYHITRFCQVVNIEPDKVSTDMLRYYLGMVGHNCQNSYVDTIRHNLNSFYQWMEDEDIIQKNPCRKIRRVKIEKKMEMPFSDTEIAQLQDSCSTLKETVLIDILMSTGIRREEITKIKTTHDIDWESRTIKIHGKGSKERLVYFTAKCKLHMQRYLHTRGYESEYLFASDRAPHGKLSVESLHSYIKELGTRSHITNVHLHRFRKWFGTSMADKGMDIRDLKELMGHE